MQSGASRSLRRRLSIWYLLLIRKAVAKAVNWSGGAESIHLRLNRGVGYVCECLLINADQNWRKFRERATTKLIFLRFNCGSQAPHLARIDLILSEMNCFEVNKSKIGTFKLIYFSCQVI